MKIYLQTTSVHRNIAVRRIHNSDTYNRVHVLPETQEIDKHVQLVVTDNPIATKYIIKAKESKSCAGNRDQLNRLVEHLKNAGKNSQNCIFQRCLLLQIPVQTLNGFLGDLERPRGRKARSYSTLRSLGSNFVKVDDLSKKSRPFFSQNLTVRKLYIGGGSRSIFHNPTGLTSPSISYVPELEIRLSRERGYCAVCQFKEVINDMKEHCEGEAHQSTFQSLAGEYRLLQKCPSKFEKIGTLGFLKNGFINSSENGAPDIAECPSSPVSVIFD